MSAGGFVLAPRGPFELRAAKAFLHGFTPSDYEAREDDVVALAFVAEDGWRPTAVELRARDDDGVEIVEVRALGPNPAGLRDQVARILSLDVDGADFLGVGERDPVIGALQRRYPGLRPVCFPSAYEAAVWGVLSHRIRMSQAARLKGAIAEEHGEAFDTAEGRRVSFPAPGRLAELVEGGELPGVPDVKRQRLKGLARAALDGLLTGDHLRGLDAAAALDELQELDGVGPFTAELILVRGAGAPDVLPTAERRLRKAVELAWGEGTRLEDVADAWRPYRSWCSLLLRRWLEDGAPPLVGR